MNKILIVDDDLNIRRLVRMFLEPAGFGVLEANDGVEALRIMEEHRVDMAILDIMMPNMDGYRLCENIRSYYEMPILMITAKAERRDKLKGFALGADDYVTKPFDPQELIARVKALLRRYTINTSGICEVGGTRLDKKQYTVTMQGKAITLPKKEFELLFTLASTPSRTFSREMLIENIWGFQFDGNERTLDVHIGRLRRKFPEAKSGFMIRTLRGLGYRLEVTEAANVIAVSDASEVAK
jgi:DNA-binding response OmpR family regulator